MNKKKSVLIITENNHSELVSKQALEGLEFRVVLSKSLQEARLKASNEEFSLMIVDLDVKGIISGNFVSEMRKKDSVGKANPLLMMGLSPEIYTQHFAHIDNTCFLSAPFTEEEFLEKLKSLEGRSKTIQSNTKEVKTGDVLLEEGSSSQEMFWVLSGEFTIYKKNSDMEDIEVGKVSTGELLGEMSFLDNLPRSGTAVATEDSEVLVIPHRKFIDVVDGQPRWFRSLMQTLSTRLRNANEDLTKLKSKI